MAYDFTTLSPDDFEALVADLLSRAWGCRLEVFKIGRDQGIDLRHSRISEGEASTIVQCKRYAPSKYKQLLSSLKQERAKLERLQVNRYVVATSVGLSPANKDSILATLAPWCRDTSDILGSDDLNALLREFPQIITAHFKLWISSTAVLERVLHARIFAITEATIEATKRNLSRLVVHDGLARALELLHASHHVLIVGNPGIGKTTLARMLMCHYMNEGFEPICISSSIDDAWTLVHNQHASPRKLLIFYDDFLGRLRFDSDRFGKNEDHLLMELVDKAARSSNLRIILTTREYILADAKRVHGAFDTRAEELLKCVLSLEDYTKAHRAKILFNHLYFSDLPEHRLSNIVKNGTYRKIVENVNFNPRVVESISKDANTRALSNGDFNAYIEQEFKNPAKLWDHPFRRDISDIARQLLAVLWLFRGQAAIPDIEAAVAKLNVSLAPEILAIQLNDAFRQLDGNFIQSNRFSSGPGGRYPTYFVVRFHNPSVEEYIDNLVSGEISWIRRLADIVGSIQQAKLIDEKARSDTLFNQLPAGFWSQLLSSSLACENTAHARLLNVLYTGADQPQLVWIIDSVSLPESTQCLLQIAEKAGSNAKSTADLKSRVLTIDGWSKLLFEVRNRHSESYAAARLQRWVTEKSRWSQHEKTLSAECFRKALMALLRSDDGLRVSLESVEILMRVGTVSGQIENDERDALVAFAESRADQVVSELDDADQVRYELSGLNTISKILATDMTFTTKKLLAHIEELEDKREKAVPSDPEKERHEAPPPEYFDVDELFRGLLER
jgi:hypothetical protein